MAQFLKIKKKKKVPNYLFVLENIKKALPFGIGFFVFFMLTSDKRLGRAVTVSWTISSGWSD